MSHHADPLRWKALALLCLAFFMVILDSQIVVLGLPSIDTDLDFSPGGVQWVMSAYLLSFGGLLLLGGRSADLLGRRRMFMIGTALFLVASLLCGLAWSSDVLVAARVLQGVSAAIMAPTALSIVMTTFEEGAERNKALGIWSSIGGLGATAALLIGGPLTDGLGWEWIFFINVPVAAAVLALSPVLLRESRADTARRSYDAAGAATITAALVALVYAIVGAHDAGWGSGRTLGLLAGSALLVAIFARIERRAAAPLVPLRILRSPMLVGGNLVMLAVGMLAFGVGLTVSLYAQQVLGYSAVEFGLGTIVLTLGAVVGSTVGQGIATRVGVRAVAAAGVVLMGAGCLLLSGVSAGGGYWSDIFPGLLVFGPGLGSAYVAASIATLAGVAERESGLASALSNAAFQIGGALGTAVMTTIAVTAAGGSDPRAALADGFGASFAAAVAFAAVGLACALVLLGRRTAAAAGHPEPAAA